MSKCPPAGMLGKETLCQVWRTLALLTSTHEAPGATYLLQGDDKEGASSGTLCDDGQEAGVDGAEVVVMHVLGDGDPVKAVLPVGHLAIDIPELGAAVLRSPGHLRDQRDGVRRVTAP